MSEKEEKSTVDETASTNGSAVEEKGQSFFDKIKKPVKPLIGWLTFGCAVAVIVLVVVLVLANVK